MTVLSPSYVQRDVVKRAMDVQTTARIDTQIDRLIQSASRHIEGVTNRLFYPVVDTRYFDWPINYSGSSGRPWQIFLDANELISLTSVTAGTVLVPTGNVFLEPANYGPPYRRLEIVLNSTSSFSGATTWQRAVAVAGLYGFRNDETPAGVLAAAVTDTVGTTITVSNSGLISPGALIRIDFERMLVTDAAMVTTGVTYVGPETASTNDNQLNVGASVTQFSVGETILLDAERMLIVDINGNNLVVKRAWDGTILTVHSNAVIYVARQLTVQRGFGGTTAATHTNAASIARHYPPAMVETACTGIALYGLGTELAGVRPQILAPVTGGEVRARRTASPVDALIDDLVAAYGRRARTRVV